MVQSLHPTQVSSIKKRILRVDASTWNRHVGLVCEADDPLAIYARLQTAVLGVREVEILPSGGAVLAVERHGPPLLVGRGAALEAGLVSIFVELAGFLSLVLIARRRGGVPWRSRLSPAGPPAAESVRPVSS